MMGLERDLNRILYENVQSKDIEDLLKFYNENILNREYVYIIVGDKKAVDLKDLEKLGEVVFVKKKELYKK